jgi:transposase
MMLPARPPGFRRYEVITGERRRRYWSLDEKLAIVAESFSAPSSISEVARRHQLNRNQLFQWRSQFRRGELGGSEVRSFVPVTISEAGSREVTSPSEPGVSGAVPMIEVVIGIATARVPSRMDEATVQVVLSVLARLR